MPNAGFPEVREAVAGRIRDETGLPFTGDHVIMTCGAAGAINVAVKTIADPGDEIIVLAPFFAEYLFYVENHGARPVVVETDENFYPDLEAIARAVTPGTRGIIVNSPNNPTGRVYDAAFYRALQDLLSDREKITGRSIYLLADDPYFRLVYDGREPQRAFPFFSNCIGISSHSKDLSIPGERIGYLAVSPACANRRELIRGMTFCNRTLGFVNAPALAQRIVASLQSLSVNIGEYQRKRDQLYQAMTKIGYAVRKPEGAFYLFPKSPIPDDIRFVEILQEKRALTVPGSGFGRPGYFRIAYCVADETIQKALPRLKEAYDEALGSV